MINAKNIKIVYSACLMIFALAFLQTSCQHKTIRFKKAALLDPMMDPAKTQNLSRSMGSEAAALNESAFSEGAGSSGASCPTCG